MRSYPLALLLLFNLWSLLSIVQASKPCSLCFENQCDVTETCRQLTLNDSEHGECICRRKYVMVGSVCVSSDDATPAPLPPRTDPITAPGNGAVVWVVMACLLLVSGGLVVYVGKKHRWLEKIYQWRIRSYNTVLVSGMNDDDAPIT